MFRLNSRNRSRGEEPFDSFVSKTLDRYTRKCNLPGYKLQPGSTMHERGAL
jgi:hypothetical protein